MVRAVFLDALGTLLELEPPWVHLARELDGMPEEQVREAFLAEMAYYREHHTEAADERSLADLRARCADVLSFALDREVDVETMMAAIRFRPYDETAETLAELRSRGLYLHVVSNWDCSLPLVLEQAQLRDLLDGVTVSAVEGTAKPDPAIFAAPLTAAGCSPDEALHVGDSEEDTQGADAAGIASVRIDRRGREGAIATLHELVPHVSA
ncbi:MAG: HAD family hydrolase [Solirubrobacterales bacterium]